MSEDAPESVSEPDSLMAEASMWFARMLGPEADMHRPEFEAWLARGALHRSFYNRAADIYAMGKFLKEETQEDSSSDTSSIEPIGRRRGTSWQLGGLLIAACLVASLIFYLMPRRPQPREMGMASVSMAAGSVLQLETADGQNLSQRLPDGSVITLKPNSALLIAYGEASRALELRRGEARFEVAHDGRPFIVRARRGSVTARGTIFDVSLLGGDRVKVHLLRGAVDVALDTMQGNASRVRRLQVGQEISFAPDAFERMTSMADSDVARPISPELLPAAIEETGQITEFSAMPLGDVVTLANRRGGRSIRLATSDLMPLKVSGRFRLDNSEQLARKLGATFDLPLDRSNPAEFVLRHR
jgi:transmembrane sensor